MSHVAADSRGVVQRMTNATPQIQLTYMPSACIIMLESAQAPVSRELDAFGAAALHHPSWEVAFWVTSLLLSHG